LNAALLLQQNEVGQLLSQTGLVAQIVLVILAGGGDIVFHVADLVRCFVGHIHKRHICATEVAVQSVAVAPVYDRRRGS